LNALPFDRPFLIEGRAPPGVTHIRVTFEEFFDAGWVFAQQPDRVAAFRVGAKAILDSVLVDSGIAAGGGFHALEPSLLYLLEQQAGSTGGLSITDVMNVLPWNWGHWAMVMRSKSVRMLTTGSLFDPTDDGAPYRERFRALAKGVVRSKSGMVWDAAMDRLIGFVVDEARDVRIASVPKPRRPVIQVTWQNIYDRPSSHEESLPTDPSARWNRLEQRLQGGTATDTQDFRMVMPPLEANRVYLVRVQAERSSSGDLEQPASLNTDFWADTATSDYVSLDVGLLYAREIKETSAYLGMNFYLRPVAKDVSLRTRGGFLRRFAFTVGLAVQNVEDARHTRRFLVGPMSVVLGVGIRFSKYVRLGGGTLIFRERDPETFPLTTRTSLTGSPYLSASFDMDVGKPLR